MGDWFSLAASNQQTEESSLENGDSKQHCIVNLKCTQIETPWTVTPRGVFSFFKLTEELVCVDGLLRFVPRTAAYFTSLNRRLNPGTLQVALCLSCQVHWLDTCSLLCQDNVICRNQVLNMDISIRRLTLDYLHRHLTCWLFSWFIKFFLSIKCMIKMLICVYQSPRRRP